MPNYLDNASIDYLFTRARQSLKIHKIRQELAEAKKIIGMKLKEKMTFERKSKFLFYDTENKTKKNYKNNFFKTDLDPISEKEEIQNENHPKSNSTEHKKISDIFMDRYKIKKDFETEEITLKNVNDKIIKRSLLNDEVMEDYTQLKGMELLIKQMEKVMNDLKQKEVDRISKEFLVNNYQEKYKVCIETVLSALCGEEGKISQMIKFSKIAKTYNENLKKMKYYSTYFNEKPIQNKSKSLNFTE